MGGRLKLIGVCACVCFAYLCMIFPLAVIFSAADRIAFDPETAPYKETANVFGAGLKKDGTPSDVLADRLATAVLLYRSGRVDRILVSGDDRFADYDEPAAMRRSLESQGIPAEAILDDFAGNRTYDTCERARRLRGIEDALLVTQAYHLPRAMWVCRHLGLDGIGVPAVQRPYFLDPWFRVREIFAIDKAFIDVFLWRPKTVE